jgi:hypothetical protein
MQFQSVSFIVQRSERTAERKLANFAREMGVNPNLILERTNALVDAHRQELSTFIASWPKHSLIRQLGEALS